MRSNDKNLKNKDTDSEHVNRCNVILSFFPEEQDYAKLI